MCVCGSCVVVRVVALSGLLVTNVNRSMQRMSALAGNGASASARRRLEVILFRGRKGEEEDAAEREPISGGGIQHVGLPN